MVVLRYGGIKGYGGSSTKEVRTMKNTLNNLFHLFGIILILFILWFLLEFTGFLPAMRSMWGVMNAAGH